MIPYLGQVFQNRHDPRIHIKILAIYEDERGLHFTTSIWPGNTILGLAPLLGQWIPVTTQ